MTDRGKRGKITTQISFKEKDRGRREREKISRESGGERNRER